MSSTQHYLDLAHEVIAPNYSPLPVVLSEGEGAWVTDVDGKRYLDALAGYSALNFGHRHPAIIDAVVEQLHKLTLTSRAFHSDQLAPFCKELAEFVGKDMVLPMNTGAEAVETALKLARRWGAMSKGISEETAKILVMDGNFHGRTISIVSFSTDEEARAHFGPFTPGFETITYGDADALEAAIDDHTVAILLEPIQGEGGVIIPPDGFLRRVRDLCDQHNILMMADEIQSGLGRTGKTFACDHEDVVPDVYILGKALGGGVLPLSAVLANTDIMSVFDPGSHGSTFGGNPLASAAGRAVIKLLADGSFQQVAAEIGDYLTGRIQELVGHGIDAVRARGLWLGIDIDPSLMTGKQACYEMAKRGVLMKDTGGSTVRLAPPLVIGREEADLIADTFAEMLSAARNT